MTVPSSLENLGDDVLERFREIVQVPARFDSPKEEEACRAVVENLNDDEIQAAARVSYAYWALLTLNDPAISPEIAENIALKIIRWHLQYIGGNNVKKATERIRECLNLRKERQMESLRTCFDKNASSDAEKKLRDNIEMDSGKQLQVLQGTDRDGRAVILRMPRHTGGTTEDAYLSQQLYVAERSAATNEFISMGKHDTVCAILNVQNQNSSVTPPLTWQHQTIKLSQLLFPGRVSKVIVVEPPFMVRQIFSAIKPFLSASLKESTFLVSGKAKTELLEATLVDPNILTSDGKLVHDIDIQAYLHETPFYLPYNYKS